MDNVYCRTGRGRKPNDPEGFKVKMNGRFQEAAWLMHKNRVVAHKSGLDVGHDSSGSQGESPTAANHHHGSDPFELRDPDVVVVGMPNGDTGNNSGHYTHPHPAKRLKTTAGGSSGSERGAESDDSHQHHHVGPLDLVVNEASGPFFMEEMRFDDAVESHPHVHPQHGRIGSATIQLPRTGWRCPGVVPDFFYQANAELVHAFAKYYVGSYRVNVVRDLRSDKYV